MGVAKNSCMLTCANDYNFAPPPPPPKYISFRRLCNVIMACSCSVLLGRQSYLAIEDRNHLWQLHYTANKQNPAWSYETACILDHLLSEALGLYTFVDTLQACMLLIDRHAQCHIYGYSYIFKHECN